MWDIRLIAAPMALLIASAVLLSATYGAIHLMPYLHLIPWWFIQAFWIGTASLGAFIAWRRRQAFTRQAHFAFTRQAVYWFCSGGALILVLSGAWNFLLGKLGPVLN